MLILVLNDEKKVDEVLLSLSQVGVRGATVIDSVGMGGILGVRLPFFSKIDEYIRIQKPDNKTIFTVIDDDRVLKQAVFTIKNKLQIEKPGTGIMFVLPVLEAYGTAEILNEEDEGYE
ncbi:MAG: P-II family nitrogen regulator [Clostridia bacterium]|nr:P-II family nitrogen regulator [Clostridia bacterium]